MPSGKPAAINKDSILAARGIGIIAVVAGHVGSFYPAPNVYYWHIPLFFFLSGSAILQRRPIQQTIRHVARDIVLYLFAWTLIYGILVSYVPPLSQANFRFPDQSLLRLVTTGVVEWNSHGIGLLSPAWFLLAYTGVTMVCTPVGRVIPGPARVPTGTVLLAFGWIIGSEQGFELGEWRPLLAGQILIGSGFCLLGSAFFSSPLAQRVATATASTVASILISALLLGIYRPRPINIAWMSVDDNILSSVTICLCGIQVVMWLSLHLRRWSWLMQIGQLSKPIMMHHLLGFALVNLVFASLGSLTIQDLGPYTVLNMQLYWWIYLAAGLAVPLGIAAGSRHCSQLLHGLPMLRSWRGRFPPATS